MSSLRNNSTTKSNLNSNTSSNSRNTSNKSSGSKNYLNNSFFSSNNTNNVRSRNNRGIVTQISNQYQQNKTVFKIIGIIALVLVILGIYYYYNYVRGKNVAAVEIKEIIDSVQDGQEEMEISAGEIPISKYSNEYGISMWFKVNGYTYRYGQEKVILKRGDEKYGTPEIILAPRDNKLIVRTRLQHPVENINSTSSSASSSNREVFEDIPTKESFAGYVAGSGSMAPLEDEDEFKDIERFISNNDAPSESSQYHSGFFDNISGNEVNNTETFIEAFQTDAEETIINRNNLEEVIIKLCTDICHAININTLSQNAKANYEFLNNNLNKIINSSDQEIKDMISNSSTETTPESSNSTLEIDTIDIFSALVSLEESGEPLDVAQLVSNVNNKMEEIDCNFRLTGNNLTTIGGNFVRRMSEILKDSIYIYYYQLGQVIKDNNPELVSNVDKLPAQVDECIVENLPLQKWVNLVISQYNQVIEIYLDGQLVSSCVLKGFPEVREEGVSLCPDGGFDGQISRLAFYNTALTQEKAYQIYRDGGSFSGDLISNMPQWVYGAGGMILLGLLIYALFM